MALEKISLLSVIPILPSFPALSHSHNCPASALGRVDLFRLLSIWPYCSGGGFALPSRYPSYVEHMTFSSGHIQRGEGGKTQPPAAPGWERRHQATYLAVVRKCWIILDQWWRGKAALQLG